MPAIKFICIEIGFPEMILERKKAKCYDVYLWVVGFWEIFFLFKCFLYEFPKSSIRHINTFYHQKIKS